MTKELIQAPLVMRNPLRQPTALDGVGDLVMLAKILSWMRPHNSDAEEQFIHDYIDVLDAESDDFGNRFVRIGNAPILYSAHVDTVHRNGGYQRLSVTPDNNNGTDFRVKQDDGNCLGADDGTGVWLLIQMLKANKPGLYIFHRGEECGCLGSKHISIKEQDLLKGINYAVAFDRRGFTSVITHQRSSRCCSEVFASALATKLGGDFKPDSTGMYTDTGEYTRQIPECTNLSVGYFNQHCANESQNIGFVRKLRDRLLEIDFLDLPHPRDPKAPIEYAHQSNSTGAGYYGSYNSGTSTYRAKKVIDMSFYELVDKHPWDAVQLLKKLGASEDDLRFQIEPWLQPGHPNYKGAASAATNTTTGNSNATSSVNFAPGYGPDDLDGWGE